MIRLHVLPHLGEIPLRKLQTERLESLYVDLLDHGRVRGEGGLAPKTVLDIHVIVRRPSTTPSVVDCLQIIPPRPPTLPDTGGTPIGPTGYGLPTSSEASSTWSNIRRQYPALWLAANTGMRRSELLGLRWDQIDFTQCRLSVNRSVVAVGYRPQESSGKTRSSRRTIDLDPATVRVLDALRHRQQSELPAWDEATPLCTKPDGNLIHPHTLSQTFERTVAKTTLPRISLHDLRHPHATLLIKAGVPLKVVSERLGHSSPAFTMATYQHVLPGMQADAAATFAALLQGNEDCGDNVLPASTR